MTLDNKNVQMFYYRVFIEIGRQSTDPMGLNRN